MDDDVCDAGAQARGAADTDAFAYLPRIVAFLESIGLRVEWGEVPDATFLPGILVIGNGMRVDRAKLKYPGDLLHEAGHLAGLPPDARRQALPDVGADGGLEMMALAWSYAAALAIGVPPAVLFHAEGYKGGATALIENFAVGRFVGVPMLQYFGMACEPRRAAEQGVPPFPHMLHWLRG